MKAIQIVHQLFHMGFLVRGGISVGAVSHNRKNIWGSAYMRVYKTEMEEADMPRILLDGVTADRLGAGHEHKGRPVRGFSLFLRDGERLIVDTLNPEKSYMRLGDDAQIGERFAGYRDTIMRARHPLGGRIRSKGEWMAGFFNDRVRERDIRGVDQVALPIPLLPFRRLVEPITEGKPWLEHFMGPGYTATLQKPEGASGL